MKSRLPKQIYFLIGAAILLGILLRQVNQQGPNSENKRIQNALDAAALISGIPSIPNLSGWPKELFSELKTVHAALNNPAERVRALGSLGEIYFANGFYGEAVQCFSALSKIEPRVPRWPYFIGLASRDYQDKSKAIASFELALLLEDSYPNIRYELGLAFVDSGHILDSIAHFEALAQRKEWEPWAHYGLARGFALEERFGEAIKQLERAIEKDSEVREFYSLAEELMLQEGDRARALKMGTMKKALFYEKRPFDPWVQALWERCYDSFRLVRLAEAEALEGNRDTALKILAKAKSIAGSLGYDSTSFEDVETLVRTLK